jgi:hypothetical protein
MSGSHNTDDLVNDMLADMCGLILDYVQDARRTHGDDAWLFPLIAPGTGGVKAWSKWFGRYLR